METVISKMVENYEQGKVSRRQLIQGLAVLASGARATAAPASTFQGIGINHLALNVTDLERSKKFYQKHLGAPLWHESPTDCFLGLGKNFLALFKMEKASVDHFCFAIENFQVDAVTEELKRQGLNPDRPKGTNRVYFLDPDGLKVQLSAADLHP